jgi:glycosyltransferase involved in cell wall biosynthesis
MHLREALERSLFAIPSIDGGATLGRMLATLNIPSKLVVVLDQGSADHTAQVCRTAGVELVQLGRRHTYAKACNIAAQIAKRRGAEYLFVANNSILFTTDVARELLQAMLDDPRLGVVAPSQLLNDVRTDQRPVVYRVRWTLDSMKLTRDFEPPGAEKRRLEADFCELTCALIRMSSLDEIGLLDEGYRFSHMDADFGFRLRQAGYSAAYVPQAQIERQATQNVSADLSEDLLEVSRIDLARDKSLFAGKFLGYGVRHEKYDGTRKVNSWIVIARNLHPYLERYGLIAADRPELSFTHPGTKPFGYLYTVWETTKLPHEWLKYKNIYEGVFTASAWNGEVFRDAGYRNVHHVPLGIETDVFHPWGGSQRLFDEKTYLWFAQNQHRKALDVILKAWAQFRRSNNQAQLVIMGVGVLGCLAHSPKYCRRWGNFVIASYPEEGISLREIIAPLAKEELADLYRSVDCVVSNSHSEGFGFVTAEAMACGTVTIFPDYAGTQEFGFSGALMLRGDEVAANYSDQGFGDVGNWWAPDVDHLVSLLRRAHAMDVRERDQLGRDALRIIRNRYTWRNTCLALRAALETIQQKADVEVGQVRAPSPAEFRPVAEAPRMPRGMLEIMASQLGLQHTPRSAQSIAAAADINSIVQQTEILAKEKGSRAATQYLLERIGLRCASDLNESYFAEALHYHLGVLEAYSSNPEKMAPHLSLSHTMPTAEAVQLFSDKVNASFVVRDWQREGIARGIPSILISCMPEASGATLVQMISGEIGIPTMQLSLGRLPDRFLVPSWLDMFLGGGAVSQDDFPASDFNVGVLSGRDLKHVFALVRDPRAAAWSSIQAGEQKGSVESEPLERRLERECLTRFIPWLQGWTDLSKQGNAPFRVHLLTYREVRSDLAGTLRKIAGLLQNDHPSLLPYTQHQTIAPLRAHFVTGDDHAWRREVSRGVLDRLWAACTPEIRSFLDLEK